MTTATKASQVIEGPPFASGIQYRDGLAVDPVMPTKTIDRPSQGGPLRILGHTPGCRNAYGDGLDDNDKLIAPNGKGCKPSDCECQGKEAEG